MVKTTTPVRTKPDVRTEPDIRFNPGELCPGQKERVVRTIRRWLR